MSEDLKHKMYDYEVAPPKAVWDAIAGGLEERETLKPLAEKMQAWEVTPPAIVWRNIVAALKGEAPVKTMTFRNIYRWSAAAAVLLMAGAYFLNYSDTTRKVVRTTLPAGIINANEPVIAEKTTENKIFAAPAKLVSPSRYNRHEVYDEEYVKILPLSYVENANAFTDEEEISITPQPILTASGELIQDRSLVNPHNDAYVTITAPNGQQTKISSRFINDMHYFSASKPDPQAKDSTMQKRIYEWRKKILESGIVPSAGNFLDILEITDLVDEKK